jgi:hypothetical protein
MPVIALVLSKPRTDTVRVPEEAMDMELVHEFDYCGTLKPPVSFGSRMFLEVVEGQVTGKRLNGRLLSGGGDWIVVGADGWGHVDVRGQIGTDDGASVYTHYTAYSSSTTR